MKNVRNTLPVPSKNSKGKMFNYDCAVTVHDDQSPRALDTLGTSGNSTKQSRDYTHRVFSDVTTAFDAWLCSLPNECTRDSYSRFVRKFLSAVDKPLNRITTNDVVQFVNSMSSWHSRHMALAGIRSFLEYTLKRPPNLKKVKIGEKPDPPPIVEPTADDMRKLWDTIESLPLVERVALRLLLETGHRRNAIVMLPRTAVQMRPQGPVIIFPPSNEKRRIASVAPISKTTYDLVNQLISSHTSPLIFAPFQIWKRRGKWLYHLVKRVAKQAEVSVRIYPHMFRHIKALQFRRENVPEDTVINTLGWRDTTIYNARYGRRQPFETAEEARKLLKEPELPVPSPKPVSEVISELALLLKEGKMDLPTYQASLMALNKDRNRNPLQGYG